MMRRDPPVFSESEPDASVSVTGSKAAGKWLCSARPGPESGVSKQDAVCEAAPAW